MEKQPRHHAGMPLDRDDAGLSLWRAGMKALAPQPNVTIRITGLGRMDWTWTTASIRPFVLETIDAFADIVADFAEAEQRGLFGLNATRIYRLAWFIGQPVASLQCRPPWLQGSGSAIRNTDP
jgi:predicted TIM-barrel fold metal-dependent hydrolase